MYKELLLTKYVGVVIDTRDWLFGMMWSRGLGDDNKGSLLTIGFICLSINIKTS